MANLCDFNMKVTGNKQDIEKFHKAMIQDGDLWMGRGADADLTFNEDGSAIIDGWCKWSIQSALIDDAYSMRKQKNTGSGMWAWDEDSQKRDYITLFEACEKFNVNMEVYSSEPGCCFQEHYACVDGEITEECVDYDEYWIDEYKSKEEAENDLKISITEEEWENNDIICRGGFSEWRFDLVA